MKPMTSFVKKVGRTIRVNFPCSKKAVYSLQRGFRIATRTPAEEDFKAVALFPDRKDILLLDIGANRGAAIDAFLMYTRKCLVYSYEPNPTTFNNITRQIKTNPRVQIFNFGLGELHGSQTLYTPVYKGYEFDGLASVIPDSQEEWLSESMFFFKEAHLNQSETRITTHRLDDLDLNPFFIKIDVEGFEFEVLKGALRTLQTSRPILLIEDVQKDDRIMGLVTDHGYEPYCYRDKKFFIGEYGSPNTFLMTEDKYQLISNQPVFRR